MVFFNLLALLFRWSSYELLKNTLHDLNPRKLLGMKENRNCLFALSFNMFNRFEGSSGKLSAQHNGTARRRRSSHSGDIGWRSFDCNSPDDESDRCGKDTTPNARHYRTEGRRKLQVEDEEGKE